MRILFLAMIAMLTLSMAPSPAMGQDDTLITVVNDPAHGAILTDAEGMTLYLFTPDTTAGESACYDECAENWPPLTPSGSMELPAGVPGELGTIQRTDGGEQVTYNDIPLYYFINDEEAGDVSGQGAGGVWFVVNPGAELGEYAAAPGEGTPVPASSLMIGFTAELGPYLVDADGLTVYLFTQDATPAESVCTGECAAEWPPVPASDTMTLPPGIQGTLSAIEREDGSMQLAYNDIPLYYYHDDVAPGDTEGHDVGDVWYIVPPGMQHGDDPHEGEEHEEEEEEAEATPAS